jgi:ectoine hydroxylase-related dioxygenase (phytanoyl-CoA dioxygenase family)
MSKTKAVSPMVRSVRPAEIEDMVNNGWVVLRELIDPDAIAGAAAAAHSVFGADGSTEVAGAETLSGVRVTRQVYKDLDALEAVVVCEPVGRAVADLFGRQSQIRLLGDMVGVATSANAVAGPNTYRQCSFGRPTDRNMIGLSFTLEQTTPEQGGVRYLSGSHRLGGLGFVQELAEDDLDTFPRLVAETTLAEATTLNPGDVVAHISTCVYTIAPNTTDVPRWTYQAGYYPGDARYVEWPNPYTAGLDLKQYQVLDHENFPVVYSGVGIEAAEVPASAFVATRGKHIA